MKGGRVKAVFFMLVFLLMLALVIHWAIELDEARRVPEGETEGQPVEIVVPENPAAQETPAPVNQPTRETAPTPAPTHAPTPAPTAAPTPAPTPSPTPTPEPTPSPAPAGQNLGSGSFVSDTGTGLNLRCDWSAVSKEDGKAEITLKISADSYSLHLDELVGRINLRVGSQTASINQPALNYDGGKTNTPFGSKTFTVELSPGENNFSVAVEWHYNGSYGETPLDVIACGGTITLMR